MRARLVADSQVMACFSPFVSVRSDPAPPGAELSEQVCQLVAESPFNLRHAMFAQARIQRDERAAKIGAAGGTEESRIPFYMHRICELRGVQRSQEFARFSLELDVAAEHDERRTRWKREIELFRLHRFGCLRSIWWSRCAA